jgi:hypothetical protein
VGVFDKDEFIVPKLKSPIQGALRSYKKKRELYYKRNLQKAY